MSSHPHPVAHLQQHIAARELAIKRHLATAARLPKAHPGSKAHRATADRLATEASALRATVEFHKTPEALAGDIEQQQIKVEYLLRSWKTSRGTKKLKLSQQLQKENMHLREMLAAAKLKAVSPPTVAEEHAAASVLPSSSLVPEASPAADVAAAQAAAPAAPVVAPKPRLFPDDPRDPYITSQRSHERFWSKIPGMDDDYAGAADADDSPWYKSPLLLVGVGLAAGWYFSKRS